MNVKKRLYRVTYDILLQLVSRQGMCFIVELSHSDPFMSNRSSSGPSGLRDQRVRTQHDFFATGEQQASSEMTSQMGYLNRSAPGEKFPRPKNNLPGEIGWLYDKHKVVKGI